MVNYGDIVPAYSSLIFSAAGTVTTGTALLTNILAGFILKRPVLADWRKLFIPFAIGYFIGGLVFLLYGSAVPRKWATLKPQNQIVNGMHEDVEASKMLKQVEENDGTMAERKD